ncbi:MAG TPA: Clp protease N-terminal domain-containing protein [Acidimicrobiales bacterium]|nr:Clp protease N-terminal domain-containing protein [Acidimicrobiales bacterium]
MPKVNVYLPDELAEAVRATGVPVSTVCQRALEEAVREVRSIKLAPGVTPTFERFTQRARNAVRLAAGFAADDGVDLGSDHVLRGLVAEGEGVAARALAQLGVTGERVAGAMEKRSSTADGNAVYLEALKEALKLGHNYIGTEHMLLAISQANTTARDVLSDLGVPSSALRSTVMQILTSIGAGPPAKPADVSAQLDAVVKRLDELEKRLPQ